MDRDFFHVLFISKKGYESQKSQAFLNHQKLSGTPRESLNHDFLKTFFGSWQKLSKSKCDKSNFPLGFQSCLHNPYGLSGSKAIITSSFLTSSGLLYYAKNMVMASNITNYKSVPSG